mmetsp:Transcript_70285/g.203779  ORF Transcript_70285/g.203779 Transcript_70285/m.203779 type:complete len:225 (+) Transcript_70285:345-1019(+)
MGCLAPPVRPAGVLDLSAAVPPALERFQAVPAPTPAGEILLTAGLEALTATGLGATVLGPPTTAPAGRTPPTDRIAPAAAPPPGMTPGRMRFGRPPAGLAPKAGDAVAGRGAQLDSGACQACWPQAPAFCQPPCIAGHCCCCGHFCHCPCCCCCCPYLSFTSFGGGAFSGAGGSPCRCWYFPISRTTRSIFAAPSDGGRGPPPCFLKGRITPASTFSFSASSPM